MEKKKKTVVIVIAGCLLILILIAVIAALVVLLVRKDADRETERTQGYVIEEDNYLQIMEEMETNVQEGYFETYMNTVWTFPDGEAETKDAILGNSPGNTRPVRYEVFLEDTKEIVFSTGVLPVGALLPAFKLDVDLDVGRYDAVCRVYLLDQQEDGTYSDYSNADFDIAIIVEN